MVPWLCLWTRVRQDVMAEGEEESCSLQGGQEAVTIREQVSDRLQLGNKKHPLQGMPPLT